MWTHVFTLHLHPSLFFHPPWFFSCNTIPPMQRQNLGDMLVAANLIDEVQMQIALAEQSQTRKRFGSTLIELQFIDENVLAAFLSKQMDVPCISLLHIDIP